MQAVSGANEINPIHPMTSADDQRPENSRRRIVVQLGQAPGSAPARSTTPGSMTPQRKGRVGRILTILGLVVVALVLALAVGAFLGWQHYRTTPTYSLALLVDAAQRNDLPGVDKIVDSDKIVDNFAGQVMDKAAGRYGGALSGEVSKAIRARVPVLLPNIKEQVRNAVAARVKEISTKADQKPFLVIALAMPYFVKVTTAGDKATAIINIHDQPVRMELERSNDLWRVVAFQDDALLERMVDELIKDLPAIGPGIESAIRKSHRKAPAVIRIP
jgi:hypothetical protein